jgi:hypothetical protein
MLNDVIHVRREAVDVGSEVRLQQRMVLLVDLAERPVGLVREGALLGVQFQFLDKLGKLSLRELGPPAEHLGGLLFSPVNQHAL